MFIILGLMINSKAEQINDIKKIEQEKIIYLLNEKDKTAEIIGNNKPIGHVQIPRSIYHEDHEYIITAIKERSFHKSSTIISINFSQDSMVRIIEKEAFAYSSIREAFIPQHVTTICEGIFYGCNFLSVLNFSEFSELQTIEKNFIFNSCIQQINIPSTVLELKDGWCNGTSNLKYITISKNNPKFKNFDELGEAVYGKSDNEYDVLFFVNRDLTNFTIPPFVKQIAPYAFNNCKIEEIAIPSFVNKIGEFAFFNSKLNYIEFSEDSELRIFEKKSFFQSSLTSIVIPPHITQICEGAFGLCQIQDLQIPENSELQIIEKNAFEFCSAVEFYVPASVKKLEDGWCSNAHFREVTIDKNNKCYKKFEEDENLIIGKSDINSDVYDVLVYADRNIKMVKIPSFIKRIAACAFYGSSLESIFIPSQVTQIGFCCFSLNKSIQKVEFSPDSQLQTIERYVFWGCNFSEISIPSSVTKIGENAFACCESLRRIEFSKDSKLQIIEKSAFPETSIENIEIPSSVVEIEEGFLTLSWTSVKVTINEKNKYYKNFEEDKNLIFGKSDKNSDVYDIFILAYRKNKRVKIPPFIKRIASSAFNNSFIEKVTIPSNVTEIGESAFSSCTYLNSIDIEANSKLRIIGENAFLLSNIRSFSITSNVKKIGKDAFDYCVNLEIIEINCNLDLESFFKKESFIFRNGVTILMPIMP